MSKKTIAALILIGLLLIGEQVMARGHEDWFITKTAFGKAVSDVGELGARFGIPYSFTRSGKVIYSDGFEASLSPWVIDESAGYGDVEIVTDFSFRGSNSVKLTPCVDGLQRAAILKILPYTVGGKVGMEGIVYGETTADYGWLLLGFRIDNVFTYYAMHFGFDEATVEYKNSANGKTVLDTLASGEPTGENAHILMKIVVDPENDVYDYVQLNNHVYDISDKAGYSFANSGPDQIQIGLYAEDIAGDQGVVYFDDITVTIDEP